MKDACLKDERRLWMQQATRSFRSCSLVYASRGTADGQGRRRFFNAQVFPRPQPVLFARLHVPYCTGCTCSSSLSIGLGIFVVHYARYLYLWCTIHDTSMHDTSMHDISMHMTPAICKIQPIKIQPISPCSRYPYGYDICDMSYDI